MLVDIVLAALPLAAWFAAYGGLLAATRPRAGRAVPATPELGDEPPAVVSLFANDWKVTVDAVESTLLDLGARRILEFRQPGDDPRQTTIHIVDEHPTGLNPYEQRIFDRVAGLAIGGVVPLTALTFRDPSAAKAWWKRINAEIIADARARGLSQRRFGRSLVTALTLAAAVVALPVGFVAYRMAVRSADDDPSGAGLSVGFVCFLLLTFLAGRPMGDRDTPAGREAAGRWLGVRDWLRGHEAFADLPPAAVAVWDRYLPYGAALGTTRTASAVIDLGLGDRRRPWSSYGGMWRRVRVRYPRFWPHYGQTAPALLFRAALALVAGYLLVSWWRSFVGDVASSLPDALDRATAPVALVGFGLGVALLVAGGYAIIRTALDLATPVTVTGQVLWVELAKTKSGGEDSPPQPVLYHLAVDDGTSDRTTAWGLPPRLFGRCAAGDTVTITARRWSRRVSTVTVDQAGAWDRVGDREAATPAQEDSPAPTGSPAALGSAEAGRNAATSLLTVEEVSRAVGVPVTVVAAPGAAALAAYGGPDGKPVLTLQVINSRLLRLARFLAGAQRTGSTRPVPGVGAEAWVDGDRAFARLPDGTMVVMGLIDRPDARERLPELLATAVSRINQAVR
jgi:Predicted membrane protein